MLLSFVTFSLIVSSSCSIVIFSKYSTFNKSYPLESSDLEISFMLFNSQANCLMILYLSFNKGMEVVPLNISSSCSIVIFSKYSTFNKSYPF